MRCTCRESCRLKVVPYYDEERRQYFVDYGFCLRCGGMVILPPEPHESVVAIVKEEAGRP